MYTVRFNKAGKWRYVHIDDRIPCDLRGQPIFARSSNPNEVWPLIIEKAYAKLHQCYEGLNAGANHTCTHTLAQVSNFNFGLQDVWTTLFAILQLSQWSDLPSTPVHEHCMFNGVKGKTWSGGQLVDMLSFGLSFVANIKKKDLV
jgi:hypothetical protein